jgi:hypothetical protein
MRFTAEYASVLLTSAGFHVERILRGKYHYLIEAKRPDSQIYCFLL